MNFDVSIIVRTYNEARFITELLSSVARQKTRRTLEVILVDSESVDGTAEIAEQFQFVKVFRIPKSKFTFGYSLNFGIEHAMGEVVVVISGHCIPVGEDWLENLVSPIFEWRVGYSFGRQIGIDEKRPDHPSTRFSERRIFKQLYPEVSRVPIVQPFMNNANSAFRLALWQQVRFDEELTGLEDLDLAIKWHSKGVSGAYLANAVVIHLHDENNARVFNRFFREELALKKILPNGIRSSALRIACLLFVDTLKDFLSATRANGGVRRFYVSIVGYRLAQYYGIYMAQKVQVKSIDSLGVVYDLLLGWITKGRCSMAMLRLLYSRQCSQKGDL
jgi:rhamnosyltransferase